MGFDIRFLEIGRTTGRGEIILDQFSERFESPFEFWTAADYEKQWREGITRILEGELKSALVTAMYPPDTANFIMWWLMYRDRNLIVFRNHLLLTEERKEPLDVSKLYCFIPDRVHSLDNEYPISEWVVTFDSVRSFTSRRQ